MDTHPDPNKYAESPNSIAHPLGNQKVAAVKSIQNEGCPSNPFLQKGHAPSSQSGKPSVSTNNLKAERRAITIHHSAVGTIPLSHLGKQVQSVCTPEKLCVGGRRRSSCYEASFITGLAQTGKKKLFLGKAFTLLTCKAKRKLPQGVTKKLRMGEHGNTVRFLRCC